MSPNQFRRNHQSGQPDHEFKQGVQSQRRKVDAASVAAHQRARDPGTSPKSRHEHGKNDRGQRRSHAKLRHRQPQPYKFAQNATESRDKEKPKKPHHSLLPLPVGLHAGRRNRKQLPARRKVHSTIHATRSGLNKPFELSRTSPRPLALPTQIRFDKPHDNFSPPLPAVDLPSPFASRSNHLRRPRYPERQITS